MIDVGHLSNVLETLLVPLYFRAAETKKGGIIEDKEAVSILEQIDYDFSTIKDDWRTEVAIAIRTYCFDDIIAKRVKEGKISTVVNLGAGLDARFSRFDELNWYQLDMPEVIELREMLLPNTVSTNIAKSVLDFSWVDDIKEKKDVLFIAEGLFMYFSEKDVKSILMHVSENFKQSYIAFDAVSKSVVGDDHKSIKTDLAPIKWGNYKLEEALENTEGLSIDDVYYPYTMFRKKWKWDVYKSFFPNYKYQYKVGVLKTD